MSLVSHTLAGNTPQEKVGQKEAAMKIRIAQSFTVNFVLLLGILFSQSASAQSFKQIQVQGNVALSQVSAGGRSVWGVASNSHPYILSGKQFIPANSTVSVSRISVGGGNSAQADTVWALNSAGKVYHAIKSGSNWTFSAIAHQGSFTLIATGLGYQDSCHPYEVWGLNSRAQIFRYNFCGKKFHTINGILCSLWVGGGDIWGNDCGGNIFRYNFASGGFDQIPGALSEIAVGPNGVFGLSSDALIWEFHDNIQNFAQLPGALSSIRAGGDGVWGLDGSAHIYRLEPSTANWVQVGGQLAPISVGSGGGVWGLDGSGKVYAFSTP
jgi:hypothetical protein